MGCGRRPSLCRKRFGIFGRAFAHSRPNHQRCYSDCRRILRSPRPYLTLAIGDARYQRPDYSIPLPKLQSDELRNGKCRHYRIVQSAGPPCRYNLPDYRQPDDRGCFGRLSWVYEKINRIYLNPTDTIGLFKNEHFDFRLPHKPLP